MTRPSGHRFIADELASPGIKASENQWPVCFSSGSGRCAPGAADSASLPYRCLAVRPTWRAASFGIDQGCDGRMAAQLAQAPAAGGPDTANCDAQLGADLGVRHGGVLDKHGDQLL